MRSISISLVVLCASLASSTGFAQKPAAHADEKAAAAPVKSAVAPSLPAQVNPGMAPALTELEQVKLQNIQLRATLLGQQQTQLGTEYQTLVAGIVREHPGFTWNPQTGSLMPVPHPALPSAAEKK